MRRACDSCGREYVAKRSSSRFCSDRCRKRAQRAPGGSLTPAVALPVTGPPVALVAAVRRELESADRLDTVLGQQALDLARRVEDSSGETGAGLASLSKELRTVMTAAMAGVETAASPLDELRARRDRKRAKSGGDR